MRVKKCLSIFVALAGIAGAESAPADLNAICTDVPEARAADCWMEQARRFQARGRLIESKKAALRGISILETILRADDPRLAVARNNLSVVYRLLGELKPAEELNLQALEVLRAKPTPDLAAVINNRGQILAHLGRWKQARDCYQEAIALWERQYGPRDPRVAMGLANLAELMQSRKDFDETERLLARVIAIDRAFFPEESPRVALDLNSIGVLASMRKRNTEAEEDFRKSIAILARTRPVDHPEVGEVTVNLAELLHRQGRIEESEPRFRRGLAILSAAWGSDSPRLLPWLEDYVAVLRSRQDFAEAERVQLQATRIRVVQIRHG